jgi:CRP-like cAMP-binding protein
VANENLLLGGLPVELRQRLRPLLTAVTLHKGQSLVEVGERGRDVHFPGSGWISLEALAIDGDAVELATVGRHGIVGISTLLGDTGSPYRAVVQIETTALRAHAVDLIPVMHQNVALRDAVLVYGGRLFNEIAQISLCHRAHTVLQRLSRWLLTTADHLESETVPATQDALTHSLGATRSAISHAISELHAGNVVWSRRGTIVIRNRQRLERTVCECYRMVCDQNGSRRPGTSEPRPRDHAVRTL